MASPLHRGIPASYDGEVELPRRCSLQPIQTVGAGLGVVALRAQAPRYQLREAPIVFDQEDPHLSMVAAAGRSRADFLTTLKPASNPQPTGGDEHQIDGDDGQTTYTATSSAASGSRIRPWPTSPIYPHVRRGLARAPMVASDPPCIPRRDLRVRRSPEALGSELLSFPGAGLHRHAAARVRPRNSG